VAGFAGELRMHIRCPKCGRRGSLPDHLVPTATSLRCRKCKAQFSTPELAGLASEWGVGSTFHSAAERGVAETSPSFRSEGFFSGVDEAEPRRSPGPGDSNYESTFPLGDARGDSGTDWESGVEEVAPEAPSSDEIDAFAPAADEAPGSLSWHHRFLEAWGLILVRAMLVLTAIAIPLVGYLLWRAIEGGPAPDRPAPALVAGLACAVSLLVISVPLMLLAAGVSDLGRDVRRLHAHLERRASSGPG
jgi:zinc-ribbon domain